jgi:hypothetical protein
MLSLFIGIFLVSWIAALLIGQQQNIESVTLTKIAEMFIGKKASYTEEVVVCRIDDYESNNLPRR